MRGAAAVIKTRPPLTVNEDAVEESFQALCLDLMAEPINELRRRVRGHGLSLQSVSKEETCRCLADVLAARRIAERADIAERERVLRERTAGGRRDRSRGTRAVAGGRKYTPSNRARPSGSSDSSDTGGHVDVADRGGEDAGSHDQVSRSGRFVVQDISSDSEETDSDLESPVESPGDRSSVHRDRLRVQMRAGAAVAAAEGARPSSKKDARTHPFKRSVRFSRYVEEKTFASESDSDSTDVGDGGVTGGGDGGVDGREGDTVPVKSVGTGVSRSGRFVVEDSTTY